MGALNDWLSQHWLWVAIALLDAVIVIRAVFIDQNNSMYALGWSLTVISLPIIGVLLYIILGRRTFNFEKRRLARIENVKQAYKAAIGEAECPAGNALEYERLIKMTERLGGSPYTTDNTAKLLVNGPAKFEALIEDIENAKHHIHMLYFIWHTDKIGTIMRDLLIKKAKQGIEVKVLYDVPANSSGQMRFFRPIVAAGGQVQKFEPHLWQNILHINYRNHRKLAVIDGQIAYTGGINIGDEYMGASDRYVGWRDTQIRLTGTAAKQIAYQFLCDWYSVNKTPAPPAEEIARKYLPASEHKGSVGAQVISCGQDTILSATKYSLIGLINSARKTLYIQTPYLIPDEPFIEALKRAALAGVDVRMMIPGTPDHAYLNCMCLSNVKELMDAGVRFFRHPGMIHAKTYVVDGQACSIGSTNITVRSFILCYETSAFVYDEGFAQHCHEVFLNDLAKSEEYTPEQHESRGMVTRVFESLLRLITPLC